MWSRGNFSGNGWCCNTKWIKHSYAIYCCNVVVLSYVTEICIWFPWTWRTNEVNNAVEKLIRYRLYTEDRVWNLDQIAKFYRTVMSTLGQVCIFEDAKWILSCSFPLSPLWSVINFYVCCVGWWNENAVSSNLSKKHIICPLATTGFACLWISFFIAGICEDITLK